VDGFLLLWKYLPYCNATHCPTTATAATVHTTHNDGRTVGMFGPVGRHLFPTPTRFTYHYGLLRYATLTVTTGRLWFSVSTRTMTAITFCGRCYTHRTTAVGFNAYPTLPLSCGGRWTCLTSGGSIPPTVFACWHSSACYTVNWTYAWMTGRHIGYAGSTMPLHRHHPYPPFDRRSGTVHTTGRTYLFFA